MEGAFTVFSKLFKSINNYVYIGDIESSLSHLIELHIYIVFIQLLTVSLRYTQHAIQYKKLTT